MNFSRRGIAALLALPEIVLAALVLGVGGIAILPIEWDCGVALIVTALLWALIAWARFGRLGAGALGVAGLMVLSRTAFASTGDAAAVDPSALVDAVFGTVISVIFYLAKAELTKLTGIQIDQAHNASVNGAIDSFVGWLTPVLEREADPAVKAALQNRHVAVAAGLIAAAVPKAVSALGLDASAIAARLNLRLGAAATGTPAAPAA